VCAVQKTEPHFRPERDPINAPPTRQAFATTAAVGRPERPAGNVRHQIAPERSSRTTSTIATPRARSWQWLPWISGAAAAILSFAVALWLTSPVAAPPGVAILASTTVSDATSLMAAVQTAGLRGSSDVKGAIEDLKRIDDERVTITGWAVDTTASSPSLTIIAFAGGRHALTATTSGPRKDVAQMFGLSDASARNVSFEATFTCVPSQNLVVVAATADRTYSQFRSLVCP
jgi:hypothetical protein